jgi:dTDP-4-amino-4,6-dideoxy-D-glucose ammonia-lyase
MLQNKKINADNWLISPDFNLPDGVSSELITNEIIKFSKEYENNSKFFEYVSKIVYLFSNNPWLKQKEIQSTLGVDISTLKILNEIIRNSEYLQNLITKSGTAKKYWQSISPFCVQLENAIENKFKYPMRIALYPGVSCMYYCGFCGRNQTEKYPSNSIENGNKIFNKVLSELDPKNSAISISGGLEPLTNPGIGDIIEFASNHGLRVPLITNGHSLTENFVKKNPKIMKLDSLRVSLYGIDEESYEFITTVKKSYKMVKRNCINFLKKRNEENSKIKFGLNYILLKENYKNLPKLIDFIDEVNNEVTNGPGIDFLSLRDDFDTVTGISDERDHDKKYHLDGLLTEQDRKELLTLFKNFESDERLKNLHIDYGYALHPIKLGILGKKLTKITDEKMRKYGHTQLSVCVDLYGDVFLYREAGFLNRNGNEKFIIGRVNENNSFKQVIENFLNNTTGIKTEKNDIRFMDPFDHVMTSLINQAEDDKNFGIPFEEGPIALRYDAQKVNLGNSWYKDAF